MDIRIGVRHAPRELSFESSQTADEIEKMVAKAIDSDAKLLKLADSKGKVYLVPTEAIAFVEIGADETRRVGFIA